MDLADTSSIDGAQNPFMRTPHSAFVRVGEPSDFPRMSCEPRRYSRFFQRY